MSAEADLEVVLREVEYLLRRRDWIVQKLREFEQKYGMSSREFYEKWTRGLIPEPEDPDLLAEFLTWQDLVEELREIEQKLAELIRAAKS